jgi:PBSX family phage terminase large subunit
MSHRSIEVRLRRLEQRRHRARPDSARSLPQWFEETGGGSQAASSWVYDPLPAQRRFHRDAARFKGYSGPIGSGKSFALAYEALFLSLINPGLLGLIGAPTYKMLEDSTRRSFMEVLDAEGIGFIFNKQENLVRLEGTGSEIIFRSMDNPERLRGPNLAWFALDELTYTREDAWTRMLGRLRHPGATRLTGCAVWTPKGYDWVYHRFVEEKNRDYCLVEASPRENTHLPAGFYDQLQDSYAERFYRQEVLGEYLDIFGGNVYYAFSNENIQPAAYNPYLPLCWALDFNVDPLCSVICQIEERKTVAWAPAYARSTVVRVLEEIVLRDSNTVAATEEVIRRISLLTEEPVRVVLKIYGDASGNGHTTKATRTDYELIREVFRRHADFSVTMSQNTANPAIRDRVNTVNNMLTTASRAHYLLIDPKCTELIKDLRQVKWKRDAAGNPTGELDKSDPLRTHTSDALSYLIAREFGMRPIGGGRPFHVA